MGPCEVLECINPNAYKVQLPAHLHTSNVFNVKHIYPYHGDNEDPELWTDLSHPGEPDAAHHSFTAITMGFSYFRIYLCSKFSFYY